MVVDPDTGETRFAVTAEEHQQNVLLFQQWLRENPERMMRGGGPRPPGVATRSPRSCTGRPTRRSV